MITAIVICAILLVIGVIWAVASYDEYDYNIPAAVLIFLAAFGILIFGLMAMKWQVGTSTLTGYVYQRSESFGYVSYDLRYSLNAGQDNQPSFCVPAGSETDKKIQALVGTDNKVEVFIPSQSFFFTNNIFQCASEAQLVKVEASNEK